MQNLILQQIGTRDENWPDSAGIRVFFTSPPQVTGGSGSIFITNADGVKHFTAPGQPFFQYPEKLLPQQTSQAKTWRFHIDPSVSTFAFTVLVAAEVPHPHGWIDISPPQAYCLAGDSIQLTAVVRDVVGRPVLGAPIVWSVWHAPAPGATVTQTGLVRNIVFGESSFRAESGGLWGIAGVEAASGVGIDGGAEYSPECMR